MTGFWGMDTAQAEDFSGQITADRGHLDDQFSALRSAVDSIIGSSWIGSDANQFGDRFRGEITPAMSDCTDLMARLAEEILRHVEEQNTASSPDDGSGGPDLPLRPTSGQGKSFWEKFGEKFQSNANPLTPMNSISTIIGVSHGLPGWLLKSAPDFIPVLGDCWTGFLAGADRFSKESHLPLGERLGRALIDSALTGAGSFIGGTVLSIAGAAAGAGICGGGLAGAGAAAGAVAGAGVGAVPGALAGLGTGAVVGGFAGGAIGDVVGSHFGAAAGNALAHAILD